MINMMYLVLTALLALNISKDILDALTKLNASLDKTVQTIDKKNAVIYKAFDDAFKENSEKTREWRDKALDVKKESDALYTYLADLKHNLIEESGGYIDGQGKGSDLAKALDAREKPANYLLNGEKHATKLKNKLDAYKNAVSVYAGANLKTSITDAFDTGKQPVGEDKVMTEWENANFEHTPLAAMLPFLTDYQAKVRNTESDLISELKSHIGDADISFTGIKPMVMPKSTYVTQGGEYEADFFVAAYDDTQQPTITINGEPLAADQIVDGVGKVRIKANKLGEQKWAGVITIKQMGKDPIVFPVERTFRVAPPTAVISPTKMNVLYRGVDNPLDIAVPGADPAKVRVSGQGVSGSNGNYMANVTNIKGKKEITINVSVDEEDADGNKKSVSYGSKKFRIKGLPLAEGSIYGKREGQMSKGLLKKAKIEARFPDFPFDINLKVTGFEIAVPGSPPERVKGTTIPSSVRTKIDKLKPGSTVSIRKIRAKGPKGLTVTKIGSISIDVN
jgi:gliding motility-associated protein GldM